MKLPKLDNSLKLKLQNIALELLSHGFSTLHVDLLSSNSQLEFKNFLKSFKNFNIKTTLTDLYSKEHEIACRYLSLEMQELHLKSLIDQEYFFSLVDNNSSGLKKHILRSGDDWGLIETQYLTTKFPKPWYFVDNTEIHIHQTIPGSVNSSLWLSELFSSVLSQKIFIRPDIFRLNLGDFSEIKLERAAMYGKPFKKEWLKNLKKVETAEHAPDQSNPLERGYRTQFIWEPLLSENKIQFSIEELPEHGDEYVCTRFIHGIYDIKSELFEHFDGAIHIYSNDEYKIRITQHLKDHNNNYKKAKIFLINSGVNIGRGEKLISAFYRWNTMPTEYFTHRS